MNQVKSASVVSTEEVWPALSVAPFWFQLKGNNSFQHSSSPVTQMCELRSSIIFSWQAVGLWLTSLFGWMLCQDNCWILLTGSYSLSYTKKLCLLFKEYFMSLISLFAFLSLQIFDSIHLFFSSSSLFSWWQKHHLFRSEITDFFLVFLFLFKIYLT